MKSASLPVLAILAVSSLSPAFALDCGKASQQVDKLICANPALKKADEAMSAAYFKLLRQTADPDFHEALIRSQRRWIRVRSGGVPRIDGENDEEPDDSKVLLKITKDRFNFLSGTTPISTMEQQRKTASNESGGPFEGYEGSCEFLPPRYGHWDYVCWIAMHRQNKDRICSVNQDWASGHTTDHRLVSVVTNGEPKAVASCYTGYEGLICPDRENIDVVGAAAHWNTNPQPSPFEMRPPRADSLWKYDPDAPTGVDEPWMQDCLFAPTYPSPDVSRPDPTPKK